MTSKELPDCRVGEVTGPCTKRPSGRFDKQGFPIMRPCAPFWVVRYMVGNVLIDKQFDNQRVAEAFWASMPPCSECEAKEA